MHHTLRTPFLSLVCKQSYNLLHHSHSLFCTRDHCVNISEGWANHNWSTETILSTDGWQWWQTHNIIQLQNCCGCIKNKDCSDSICYVPATKWLGHIVLPMYFEILTWYLVCGCIMRSYRSSLRSGPMIFGPWTLKFGQIFSCHHFFSLCLEMLTWWVTDQAYVSFRSNDFWPSYGPWTSKFDQIFSCHLFFSLCLEILTWFLVWECIIIIYKSTLKFILGEWFLANLQPLGFEIWPNI